VAALCATRDPSGGFGPEIAQRIGLPHDDLLVEGRDGTGPKTEVPWFRFGSKARSPSATTGWYCVYLFDTHGEMAYLCLGRGSTEWNGVEFKPRDHGELRGQASWARGVLGEDTEGLSDSISLKSRRSPLGPSYEAGTVVALGYRRSSIPPDERLRADALRMAELLGRIYTEEASDPAAPGVPPEVNAAREAAARTAGKPLPKSGFAGFRPDARQRKAIEDRGMEIARQALTQEWESVVDTSANRPYDFHCRSGERELFVEVTATIKDGSEVILTRNEVVHSRSKYPDTALAIVSGVTPPEAHEDLATGGVLTLLCPWQADDADLSVVSYVYRVPTDNIGT